jgi:cytoskeletal protein CcmA (bactofilin family)
VTDAAAAIANDRSRAIASPDPAPASAAELEALPEGASFAGLLVLPRDARIDGHVRGEVLAGGSLRVGPNGRVEADLEAASVVVEGRVEGSVRAQTTIALGPAAAVRGDLEAPALSIAEGARVEGRCACGVRNDASSS